MREVEIIERQPMLVAGYHAAFIHILSPDCNSGEVIGALWGRFLPDAERVENGVAGPLYGVIYGLPEAERSHPHELHYIACREVTSSDGQPDGMVTREVAGGTYAVITHHGKLDGLAATIAHLYRTWLPGSGYEHAGIADIEVYGDRFDPESDASELDYLISVAPGAANGGEGAPGA